MRVRTSILAICLGLLIAASAMPARADMDLGVRGGLYSDAEAGFLGFELLTDITRQWYFNPNLEYVFVDDGDLFTLNLDAHYDFPSRARHYFWLGGGPAVIFQDRDVERGRRIERVDETDIGLNLLAGLGFGKGQAIRPYVQGKILLADDTEAVLAFGLRFN